MVLMEKKLMEIGMVFAPIRSKKRKFPGVKVDSLSNTPPLGWGGGVEILGFFDRFLSFLGFFAFCNKPFGEWIFRSGK